MRTHQVALGQTVCLVPDLLFTPECALALTPQGFSNVTDEMLEVLPSLVHLHELTINSDHISGRIWPLLGKLPELRSVSLQVSSQLTCEGLGELRNSPQLKSLSLGNTQVVDADLEPLGDLPELNGLRLFTTSISDAGLVHLERCHELRTLDLRGTNVTAAGVARLQEVLPRCQIIWSAPTVDAVK